MNEYQMMIHTPRALFDMYINQMITGQALTIDQQIKFVYLKTLFVVDVEIPNQEVVEDAI
jgi:hypothetical protein